MTRHWREPIAKALDDHLGFRGLHGLYVAKFGKEWESAENRHLSNALLDALGVPARPGVSGPRNGFRLPTEELQRVVADPSSSPVELGGAVGQFFKSLEQALMETVMAYHQALPGIRKRIEEKVGDRKGTGPLESSVPDTLRSRVYSLDLGKLIALIGTLVKDTRPGAALAAEYGRLVDTERVKGAEIRDLLDALRGQRPPWVHGGHPVVSAVDARALLDLALRLQDAGVSGMFPRTVVIVGRTQDSWGRHLRIVDETGTESFAFRVEGAEADHGLLSEFYLLAATNPAPVRPVLIPAPHKRDRSAASG